MPNTSQVLPGQSMVGMAVGSGLFPEPRWKQREIGLRRGKDWDRAPWGGVEGEELEAPHSSCAEEPGTA